jgi:hypothetical protein
MSKNQVCFSDSKANKVVLNFRRKILFNFKIATAVVLTSAVALLAGVNPAHAGDYNQDNDNHGYQQDHSNQGYKRDRGNDYDRGENQYERHHQKPVVKKVIKKVIIVQPQPHYNKHKRHEGYKKVIKYNNHYQGVSNHDRPCKD